nr:MAG TPA: hypothetical protein [Caudoviricetes sp.]
MGRNRNSNLYSAKYTAVNITVVYFLLLTFLSICYNRIKLYACIFRKCMHRVVITS